MKFRKQTARGSLVAVAVAIGVIGLTAAPALAWGSTGWLSSNGIYTVDGCGVYSSMTDSKWSSDKTTASETYSCAGDVESDMQYRTPLGVYGVVIGPWNSSLSTVTAPYYGEVTNHRANH